VLDSACGYAAYSLADATSGVLTVEYKINLIAPAVTTVKARGYVLKRGKTLTVCRAEAVSTSEERERLLAAMTATIMEIRNGDVTA
jgi:acyl-coenzyme A thioesterase PaaI-like protein